MTCLSTASSSARSESRIAACDSPGANPGMPFFGRFDCLPAFNARRRKMCLSPLWPAPLRWRNSRAAPARPPKLRAQEHRSESLRRESRTQSRSRRDRTTREDHWGIPPREGSVPQCVRRRRRLPRGNRSGIGQQRRTCLPRRSTSRPTSHPRSQPVSPSLAGPGRPRK